MVPIIGAQAQAMRTCAAPGHANGALPGTPGTTALHLRQNRTLAAGAFEFLKQPRGRDMIHQAIRPFRASQNEQTAIEFPHEKARHRRQMEQRQGFRIHPQS
jgi:hypothetical protein